MARCKLHEALRYNITREILLATPLRISLRESTLPGRLG